MAKRMPRIRKGPRGVNKLELLIWLVPAAIEVIRKIVEEAPRIWDAAEKIRDRWKEKKRAKQTECAEPGELRLEDEQGSPPVKNLNPKRTQE